MVDDFVQRDDHPGGLKTATSSRIDNDPPPVSKKAGLISDEYEALLSSALEEQARHWDEVVARKKTELTVKLLDIDGSSNSRSNSNAIVSDLREEIQKLTSSIQEIQKNTVLQLHNERVLKLQTSKLMTAQQKLNCKYESKLEAQNNTKQQHRTQLDDLHQQISDLKAFVFMQKQVKKDDSLKGSSVIGMM